jgi:hypothetical protein
MLRHELPRSDQTARSEPPHRQRLRTAFTYGSPRQAGDGAEVVARAWVVAAPPDDQVDEPRREDDRPRTKTLRDYMQVQVIEDVERICSTFQVEQILALGRR